LQNGQLEVVDRATKQSQEIAVDQVVAIIRQWINSAVARQV
jgi:prolyl-tRNA synthetase